MKLKRKIGLLVLILSVFLFAIPFSSHAQMTWGERLRERFRERMKERRSEGQPPYESGDFDFSVVHEGLTRKYRVHLPPGYDRTKKMPVVIYLHGGGGSMRAAYRDRIDKASDKFGFILVVPAGTGLIPDRLLTWNGGEWPKGKGGFGTESCCGYAAKNNIDDVGFISKMIEEVKGNFNVDEGRVYATGISNGGLMSYRLACEL